VAWTSVVLGVAAPTLNPALRSLSIIGRGPAFVLGMLAAWVYDRHGNTLRIRLAASRWLSAGGSDLMLLLVLAALAAVLRWKLQFPTALWSPTELIELVPDGFLWSAVLIILLLFPLRGKALFSNRFLRWLGVISYSIYLVHVPLIRFSLAAARRWVPEMGISWSPIASVWFVCVTLVCLGISSLTYRLIEQPFLERKARVASTRFPVAAGAP
jgi:peptidoglycan/LPS O-acetylase OafA/YrhL